MPGSRTLISVTEAFQQILAAIDPAATGAVSRLSSHEPDVGYNAQDLLADRDLPPFDRVAMDGVAIVYAAWAQGQRCFELQGLQAAGQEALTLADPQLAIEVMTGAVLPKGCDTVIRYEDLSRAHGSVHLAPDLVIKQGQNIHRQGHDARKGQCLVARGARLRSPQWALAAAIGCYELPVMQGPRLSFIGTGDELVAIHEIPLAHQVRASNSIAMMAAARERGFRKLRERLVSDRREELVAAIEQELQQSEVCILSGAVSMGAFDLVPDCLKELDVQEIFHKVRQRPGKPLWFGRHPAGNLVFGLPGNPVSALICFYRYVLPALERWRNPEAIHAPRLARLAEDLNFSRGLEMSLFAPVRISYGQDAVLYAQALNGIGSGDLASLALSDGFIECAEGTTKFPAGSVLPVYPWDLS